VSVADEHTAGYGGDDNDNNDDDDDDDVHPPPPDVPLTRVELAHAAAMAASAGAGGDGMDGAAVWGGPSSPGKARSNAARRALALCTRHGDSWRAALGGAKAGVDEPMPASTAALLGGLLAPDGNGGGDGARASGRRNSRGAAPPPLATPLRSSAAHATVACGAAALALPHADRTAAAAAAASDAATYATALALLHDALRGDADDAGGAQVVRDTVPLASLVAGGRAGYASVRPHYSRPNWVAAGERACAAPLGGTLLLLANALLHELNDHPLAASGCATVAAVSPAATRLLTLLETVAPWAMEEDGAWARGSSGDDASTGAAASKATVAAASSRRRSSSSGGCGGGNAAVAPLRLVAALLTQAVDRLVHLEAPADDGGGGGGGGGGGMMRSLAAERAANSDPREGREGGAGDGADGRQPSGGVGSGSADGSGCDSGNDGTTAHTAAARLLHVLRRLPMAGLARVETAAGVLRTLCEASKAAPPAATTAASALLSVRASHRLRAHGYD
jgi:hypothetical protein